MAREVFLKTKNGIACVPFELGAVVEDTLLAFEIDPCSKVVLVI